MKKWNGKKGGTCHKKKKRKGGRWGGWKGEKGVWGAPRG